MFKKLLLIVLLLAPLRLQAENLFEGVVNFRMTHGGKVTDMQHYLKGSKMRMEIAIGPGMSSIGISDYEKKKLYMLMPQANMYMEMSLNMQELSSSANKSLENAQVTQTDEHQDILGYKCTKWLSKQGNQTTEMWIAKGFGKFYQPDSGQQNSALAALQKQLLAEDGFPFRVIQFTPDGKELYRMEVVNVEKKALKDDLFAVPANYKKMEMPVAPQKKP